jgi:hypothetical protein
MLNKRKRRPTHPGEILREDVLPAAGLTQDKLARLLWRLATHCERDIARAQTCYDRHGTQARTRFRYVAGDVAGPTAGR